MAESEKEKLVWQLPPWVDPAPWWWFRRWEDEPIPVPKEYEEYMDQGQKKALAKMQLDMKIDMMNAQLKLVNTYAQKQMEMLKRVSEMTK
jgi:hypothetical protein